MKKLFALILAVIMTVSLVACAGTQDLIVDVTDETLAPADTAAIRESYDKADAYISALLDGADMESQVQDDDNGASIYKSWFSAETAEIDPINEEIEIGGNTITVGTTTAKDVEGFQNVTVQANAEKAETEENISINLSNGNKYCDVITEINHAAEAKSLEELVISDVETGFGEYALDFNYCGLTTQSTLKDVLDTLGMPNNSVSLSADEIRTGIEVSYTNSVENGGNEVTDTFVTLALEYDADSDTAAVCRVALRKETYTLEEISE